MMESASTYRAVQAAAPGRLKLVRTPIRDPGPDEVRIRVEACGVCHSHAATVDGVFPIDWPRVPGTEAVGRIDVLSAHVQIWVPRQRVGVGFPGGFCGYCRYCRGGDLLNCPNQEFTGIHRDGGYAEILIAKASGLMSIPDDLSSVDAASLTAGRLPRGTTFMTGFVTGKKPVTVPSPESAGSFEQFNQTMKEESHDELRTLELAPCRSPSKSTSKLISSKLTATCRFSGSCATCSG
jgi:NADPH:quinone reductase-like Zn-dependent oxidoreductase